MSVKKVTIEKKDLPPLTPNGEYLIRYRIISEDKNRTSHWSPIYTLDLRRVQKETNDAASDLTFAAANISTTSNLISKEHNFLLGQMVKFSAGGGTAPNTNLGPLATGTSYYVEPVSNLLFYLHVSRASAFGEAGLGGKIDFLSAGTGTAFTLTSDTKSFIRDVTSSVTVTPTTIIIDWGDTNDASSYDIFVSLKTTEVWGSYSYHGSSLTHSYSFLKPTAAEVTGMRIAIQLAGIEKTAQNGYYNDILTIATKEFALQASLDGGSA
jgi:hypothetical protein